MHDVTKEPMRKEYAGTVSEVQVIGSIPTEAIVVAVHLRVNGDRVMVTATPEEFDTIVHDLAAVNGRVQESARRFKRAIRLAREGMRDAAVGAAVSG